MKQILFNVKSVLLLAVIGLMSSHAIAQTANSVTMKVKNPVQLNTTQFTYEVWLYNTGTSSYLLKAYSFGINYATGMGNGGTLSHTFLNRDAAFPGSFPALTAGINTSLNHLRATTTSAPAGSEVAMNSGDSIRLGTMRVNSTVAFAANFNPSFTMQLTTVTGKTSCVATCIYGTTTYAVNAPGNQPLAGTLQVLNTSVNTPCFYLSPSAGSFTATASAQTAVNCFGGSDGTATYTLSGLGANTGGTYSVDGGTAVSYASSPVTVSGLNGGTHSIVFTSASGCTTSASVTISAPASGATSSESATACDSYTWNVNGTTYTASGVYSGTMASGSGCPVLVTLNLSINNSTNGSSNASACDSYTWTMDNATYTASGSYSATSLNAAGCVHTQTLNLTINQSTSTTSAATACDMYTWNGNTYTTSGNYTVTSMNNAGCLHTDMLSLTIFQSAVSNESEVACNTFTWSQNGTTYTSSGTYTALGYTAAGCPDYHTLYLTINQSTSNINSVTACDSYAWSVNGITYNASGTYTSTSLNAAGCTHMETLNLTINQSTSSSNSPVACDSYTWSENGITYNASGVYTATSINASGCVHTANLNLTVNYSSNSSVSTTACDSYTWNVNGTNYNASGAYTATTLNNAGCTETVTLNLTINQSSSSSSSAAACDSYTWNGSTYTTSGSYSYTSLNASNCTHTETLALTVNSSTTTSSSATNCDSYTWAENGATYTVGGTYTSTSINAVGCLHTSILNLTVNYSSSSSVSEIACDSYTWNANGTTYNTSGAYTATTLNNAGCTEIVTLNLTINQSSSSSSSAAACDSYTWNGSTYTASGSYSYTSLNASNCIHTETLTLTVNYSTSNGNATETACDSFTWNGSTYTTSGTYSYTTLNNAGCVNTATLNLTVNYSSANGDATVTACDAYSWNGSTYTTNGIYTYTSLNASGCVNTATLNLTINYSSSTSSSATACDTYTWADNGQTYNMTGTYTYTSLNNFGCVNTATLHVTVNYSTSNTATQVACDQYTWSINGMNYTQSGNYSATSLNASGCTHTDNLALTVNYSSSASQPTLACDSYSWPISGSTYTASGTYVSTSLNAAGCTHTDVLSLTVNYSSSSAQRLIACNSYTWPINGMTYTTSGVYTGTSLNASGCTHTTTLSLKIGSGSWLAIRAILSGSYNASTGLMNDNLRAAGLIPTTEPYTAPPYSKLVAGFPAGETVDPSVLATTGNNAIVDWVYIELRSSANSAIVTRTIRALIQRDGDVVDPWDGTSPVLLPGLTGSFFVSLKHRTHLGVMTNTAVSFSLCNATTFVNFITGTNVWVRPNTSPNGPRRMYGSIGTLWGGNSNLNKTTRYNSSLENDKDPILSALGGNSNNVLSNVYRAEDLNMNGNVKYNNTDNDKDVITSNLFAIPGATNNTTITQHTPN